MQTHSIEIVRTTSDNLVFRNLVDALDTDLNIRNGDIQRQYDRYNKIDNIKHAVVIYAEGRPVGCGCFKKFSESAVEIKRMFVFPEMRGKQLAAQMLQELENWALEEGFTASVLETGRRQVEAHRLYERAGYSRIENYGQYEGMEDSICYGKELK